MALAPGPGVFLFVIYPFGDFSFYPLTTAFIGGQLISWIAALLRILHPPFIADHYSKRNRPTNSMCQAVLGLTLKLSLVRMPHIRGYDKSDKA